MTKKEKEKKRRKKKLSVYLLPGTPGRQQHLRGMGLFDMWFTGGSAWAIARNVILLKIVANFSDEIEECTMTLHSPIR